MSYSDEHIEYWGRVFLSRDLYRHGIRFDTFLLAPHEILEAVALIDDDVEPLLPAQAAAMHAQIEAELVPPGAHLRGGGYVEPMRHHSYAVSLQRHMR